MNKLLDKIKSINYILDEFGVVIALVARLVIVTVVFVSFVNNEVKSNWFIMFIMLWYIIYPAYSYYFNKFYWILKPYQWEQNETNQYNKIDT